MNLEDSLINIINEFKIFTNDNLDDLNESITQLIHEYIINNISDIINKDFDKNLTKYIYEIFLIQILHLFKSYIRYRVKFKLIQAIKSIKNKIYSKIIPPRSYKDSFIRNINYNDNYNNHISEKICILQATYQPSQRSEEWYTFRHNLLTASSIWKVFGSQATQNQLIYEKCKPYTIYGQTSTSSPLHWGQKYEPISVEFYKKVYETEIGDFGCIKHPKYSFIGASPDGINIASTNKRYGRMLEIKNVVSREITGIPKLEYWVQMQLQMETCDLNECDFLETKFIEYESEEDFLNDGSYIFSDDNKVKGRIIQFSIDGKTHYEYAPLYHTLEQYNDWEKIIFEKNTDKEWIQNIFWKLQKYSNILVLRNKLWFNNVITKIEELWNIIINERITGFQHRAPNSKKRTKNHDSQDLIVNKCYVIMDTINTT